MLNFGQTFSRRARLSQPAILTALALTGLALLAWHATSGRRVDDTAALQTQMPVSPVEFHRVLSGGADLPAVAR
jgi:hypothetical protein